jgi:predicted transcriptional regulator
VVKNVAHHSLRVKHGQEYEQAYEGSATMTEIAQALDRDNSHIRREINELVVKDRLVRGPRQGRNVPYYLPEVSVPGS